MKTHNVNPHSGDNQPEFKQVFGSAIIGASTHDAILSIKAKTRSPIKRVPVTRQPILPRKLLQDEAKELNMGAEITEQMVKRNPIMPERFSDEQDENKNIQHVKINKPDF